MYLKKGMKETEIKVRRKRMKQMNNRITLKLVYVNQSSRIFLCPRSANYLYYYPYCVQWRRPLLCLRFYGLLEGCLGGSS